MTPSIINTGGRFHRALVILVGTICMLMAPFTFVATYPDTRALVLGTATTAWPAFTAITLIAAWIAYGMFAFQPNSVRWATITGVLAITGLALAALGLAPTAQWGTHILMLLTVIVFWPKATTTSTPS